MYSETILHYYEHPPNKRKLENASIHGKEMNPMCGDEVEVYLKADEQGKIKEASFDGQGCAISQASVSMLLGKLEGKTLEDAKSIGEKEVIANLGVTISPARTKCALLGWVAMKKAIVKH